MPSFERLCRLAAIFAALGLAACDAADWRSSTGPQPVNNAANSQPQPLSSFPRGALNYTDPPNGMQIPSSASWTFKTN